MGHTRMFGKINQRGITWKLKKGDQSVLFTTHRHDLIHIPIKLHEDTSNSYLVMGRTRMFGKKWSKRHNLETKKGGSISLVHDTLS